MTRYIALVVLFYAVGAQAQKPPTISERRACYEQARRFVSDLNKDSKANGGHRSVSYLASHYNAKNGDCLVEYADSDYGSFSKAVADAFGSGEVAFFLKQYTREKPVTCYVGEKSCNAEPQFDSLVSELFK